MRIRVFFCCLGATFGLVLAALLLPLYATHAADPAASPSPSAPPPSLLQPRPVAFSAPSDFQSWALMDRRTHKISGSANLAATTDTASMVKVWLAADYLRRAAADRQQPDGDELHTLSIMIRDSDNDAAQDTYVRNGSTASIQRLVSTCHLTDSRAVPDFWSETEMSARDAVRMGECIADGTAAGRAWTPWVLDEMRHVRGDGRFGVVDALPSTVAGDVAIKNGWLLRDTDGLWHVNCLAVGDSWILAVMQRYDGSLGFAHGGDVCASVTRQLLNPAVATAK